MLTRTLKLIAVSGDVDGGSTHHDAVRVHARLVLEKPEGGELELVSFAGIGSQERDLGPELVGFLDAVRAEVKDVLEYMAEETEQNEPGTVVE